MHSYVLPAKRILALLALIALGFSSASARASAQTQAPLEINFLLSLTGGAAFLGKAEQQAFDLAENYVNAHGGVRGRPVKFIYNDDASTPATGLQIVSGLIAQKVPVIIGSPLVSVCAAIVPPLLAAGPVNFCLAPPLKPPANSYIFTVGATATDLGAALLRNLRERGLTRIGIITTTDATGHDVDEAFNGLLARPENKVFNVVAFEHFAPSDISVAAQLARIKAGNPQALITWTVGAPTGTLFRGIRDIGLDIPIAASNANMLYAELGQFQAILPPNLFFPAYRALAEGAASPAIHAAQAPFFAALKSAGAKADIANVLGWDPTMLIISALRTIGPNATPDQIRDYILAQKHVAGVNGYYDFSDGSQRGLSSSEIVIDRWDAAKGTFVLISKPGGGL